MHSLALALTQKGYTISGSDDTIYEPSWSKLKNFDLLPTQMGWFPEKINSSLDAVILGMHALEDNPELQKAREIDLKIYSYPEFLYELSKNKTRVVIGGSHGKTTITSMILHVMHYHGKSIDYMVGAQLEGFSNMVHLSEDNDFILLEGDEYLSSVIDRRPKFHIYKPNIALLSGIAWDHINVFPTYEIYLEQFRIFIDSIVRGGMLVYNEEDEDLSKIVEDNSNQIRKQGYSTPQFKIENGITVLDTPEGDLPVEIIGAHNMSNLSGAKWVCQHMGVDENDFYEAIASFKGASKRLEKIAYSPSTVVYKDFAHSPSKVKATTHSVWNQYPDKKVYACLELHTFSSLSPQFLSQYHSSLDNADEAVIFYSPETLENKRMQPLSEQQIREAFGRKDLIVFTDPLEFQKYLRNLDYSNSAILLMSSGTFGGLDFKEINSWIK